MEKCKQTTEESIRAAEQSYLNAFENIRDLNVKLIDIAQANTEALCSFARDITTAKAPSDVVEVWMDHSRKQFEMATKHAGELTTLGQKIATESTAPMTRTAEQAFRRYDLNYVAVARSLQKKIAPAMPPAGRTH